MWEIRSVQELPPDVVGGKAPVQFSELHNEYADVEIVLSWSVVPITRSINSITMIVPFEDYYVAPNSEISVLINEKEHNSLWQWIAQREKFPLLTTTLDIVFV